MKLSIKQLTEVLTAYVQENKISVATFTETRDNSVGLLDKIGKIFTITHNFVDKLEMFDGEFLSYGKTVEEWANDLILPEISGTQMFFIGLIQRLKPFLFCYIFNCL